MDSILNSINRMGAFEVNILASTVFLAVTLFIRVVVKKAARSSKAFLKIYEEMYFYKYVAHKNIYDSEHVPEPIKFFFLVCLTSLKWLILALMVITFVHGVDAITSGEWFILVGYWFAFNYMLEAYTWARDSRNDKTAKTIFQKKTESQSAEKGSQ